MNLFLLLLAIVLLILVYKSYNLRNIENFTDKNKEKEEEVPKVTRPYVNVYDNFGNRLNVIFISKPMTGDDHYKTYTENKDKKILFMGVTSYLEFPNPVSNPFEDFTENYKKYRYKEICRGWLHCFRDPEKYFPPNIPRALISESDFTDCSIVKPDSKVDKVYDFIYICLKQNVKLKKCDDWATYNKNWDLAKKCLKIMCEKFKLKGLLVGRESCEIPNSCHKLMYATEMLNYEVIRKSYQQSRFIFIPNQADASPRVISEALCSGLPCLINKNILGGWKYINSDTGEFFTDENDIERALNVLLPKIKENKYSPRKYFIDNYSVVNSGKKLKHFMYDNFHNELNIPEAEVDYLTIDFPKVNYTECLE